MNFGRTVSKVANPQLSQFVGLDAGAVSGCRSLRLLQRRQAIQVLGISAAGSWLTGVAEHLALAGEQTRASRSKSLLILWCQGGPSQLETFDPHPGTKIGGDVGSIDSSLMGVRLADTMPAMAEQMHRVCLVRSMVSKEGDHERATYHLKTGWRPDPTVIHPAIGSILCYASESNLEIPRHVSILSSQWPARGGYLGPKVDSFKTSDPLGPVPNLEARVAPERLVRRYDLLEMFEEEFQQKRIAGLDQNRTLHRTATQRAAIMMDSSQLSAFDIANESAALRGAFGENPFGRSCLAAVRLLETGVRCVEVELNGWDTHINNHQLQSDKAAILDIAMAATLTELERRDLLSHTIVVCGGEFGRTPQINAASGRDHWPHGFSMALAGGPFRRGFVYGATNPNPDLKQMEGSQGSEILQQWTEKPVTVPDLHATLLSALDIDHSDLQMTPIGRPLAWSEGNVINELLDHNAG